MLALICENEVVMKNKFDKLKEWIKRELGRIEIEQNGDKTIYKIINPHENNPKYIEKLSNKLVKQLKNDNKTIVILSSKLKGNKIIKNKLYSNGVRILDGKWLFKFLSIYLLEYVLKQSTEEIENQTITIMVNDLSEVNLKIIMTLAPKVKSLHIITNHIQKFKKVENILYEEMGIVISLSSNKKKGLAKAKLILNLDFPEELLNNYVIYPYAVIINIEHNVRNLPKSFNGVVINNCKIDVDGKIKEKFEEESKFDLEDLYEAQILRKYNIEDTFAKLKADKVEIQKVIGKNGIIEEQEFENIKKQKNGKR